MDKFESDNIYSIVLATNSIAMSWTGLLGVASLSAPLNVYQRRGGKRSIYPVDQSII